MIDGCVINYAVGPVPDRPPLLLIHGQGVDWQSYAPAMPALARFGDAFYTGRWDRGFDHEQILRGIEVPTTLIHANWTYGSDGILQGAIDDNDAQRIASLINDVRLVEVDSGHNVHGEKPARFAELVCSIKARLR